MKLLLAGLPLLLAPFCGAQVPLAPRPCDLLAATTPCVEAISTTRSLLSGYQGPLYQVMRERDHATRDIGQTPEGYADAAAEDEFCGPGVCVFSRLYDQSGHGNDLTPAPPGGAAHGPGPHGFDLPARARVVPVMLDGHKVYGIDITPGMGYRNDRTHDIPRHGEPEGVYMVTSALHLNTKCCFDFGNAETNNRDNDKGHMDAINIREEQNTDGQIRANLDMENGLFGHLPIAPGTPFVTDMGTNDGQHTFFINGGNAQGGLLHSTGPRPLGPRYQPMQQEGAVILGIGGDNSNRASGYFFEGAMTKGMPDEATLQAVQANIVAARYAGELRP